MRRLRYFYRSISTVLMDTLEEAMIPRKVGGYCTQKFLLCSFCPRRMGNEMAHVVEDGRLQRDAGALLLHSVKAQFCVSYGT